MASGPRQFVAKFLTDLSKFETRKAADDTETLGVAAGKAGADLQEMGREADRAGAQVSDAGSDLKALGTDAERAGTDVAEIGDAAEGAARDVDTAFDRIKAASKAGAGAMDDAGRSAKESLGEVGEEGAGTAREVAASFDGSAESITDGFQEVAANALAVLGPAGLAVGVAAAAGIGLVRAGVEAAKERVADLTDRLKELQDADDGGRDTLKSFLDGLDTKSLRRLSEDADLLGISLTTLARARAGERDAILEVVDAQDRTTASQLAQLESTANSEAAIANLATGVQGLSKDTRALAGDYEVSSAALGIYNEAMAEAEAAAAEQAIATQAAADANAAVAAVTADAAAQTSAAWGESAEKIEGSLAGVTQTLNDQAKAAEDYADNVAAAAGRVSEQVIEQLMELPDGGRKAFAELGSASAEEIAAIEAAVSRNRIAEATAGQISAGAGMTREAGVRVGTAYREGLVASGSISDADARAIAARSNAALERNPIVQRVRMQYDEGELIRMRNRAQANARTVN